MNMSTASAQTRIVLGQDSAGMYLTPEEFDAIKDYDPNFRYELMQGVLVVWPVPLEAHDGPNEELGRLLLNYRYDHPKGGALDETLPNRYVRINGTRRLADRVVWAGLGRQPIPKEDTPTIVVEFVSAGKRNRLRDYETKRDEYLSAGVKEDWIIDRFQRILTVYRSDGTELVISAKKSYRPPLLPGFVLPVARLLEVADRWAAVE
jgi:Uma2 family endonuclease